MAGEVSRILGEAGVDVVWSKLTESPSTDVVVILTPADATRFGLPKETLGAVLGGDGPLDCVYVFYPAVARLVTLGPVRSRSTRDFNELGRAVGRVAAHEIVHALSPNVAHTRDGLMVRRLTRSALSRPKLAMSTPVALAVRRSVDALRRDR